jgi:hypothetical protein
MKKYKLCSYKRPCWKCGKIITIYYIEGCNPESNEKIGEWLLTNDPEIKRQYSRTLRRDTIANQCPHCKSLQGNWFVYEDDDMIARRYNQYDIKLEREFEV